VGGIKSFFIGILIGAVLATCGVWAILSYINGERDTATDRELRELRDGYTELESNYFSLRATEAELRRLNNARRELDSRTREEVEGIGRTISQLQIQGGSLAEKVRVIIEALKEIKGRVNRMENYLNSLGYYYVDRF
jgi:chromosome segregation ATPase